MNQRLITRTLSGGIFGIGVENAAARNTAKSQLAHRQSMTISLRTHSVLLAKKASSVEEHEKYVTKLLENLSKVSKLEKTAPQSLKPTKAGHKPQASKLIEHRTDSETALKNLPTVSKLEKIVPQSPKIVHKGPTKHASVACTVSGTHSYRLPKSGENEQASKLEDNKKDVRKVVKNPPAASRPEKIVPQSPKPTKAGQKPQASKLIEHKTDSETTLKNLPTVSKLKKIVPQSPKIVHKGPTKHASVACTVSGTHSCRLPKSGENEQASKLEDNKKDVRKVVKNSPAVSRPEKIVPQSLKTTKNQQAVNLEKNKKDSEKAPKSLPTVAKLEKTVPRSPKITQKIPMKHVTDSESAPDRCKLQKSGDNQQPFKLEENSVDNEYTAPSGCAKCCEAINDYINKNQRSLITATFCAMLVIFIVVDLPQN